MSSKRPRVRLQRKKVSVWTPEWNEVRGWAINFIRKNYWRREYIVDFDDCLQDAYIVFLKVADRYPQVVEPKHFFSLYRTALTNFYLDQQRYLRRKNEYIDEHVSADELAPLAADTPIDQVLAEVMNASAPELRKLVAFISNDDNLKKLRAPQREAKGAARQNIDQRLSALLGVSNFPFREEMRQLLLQ